MGSEGLCSGSERDANSACNCEEVVRSSSIEGIDDTASSRSLSSSRAKCKMAIFCIKLSASLPRRSRRPLAQLSTVSIFKDEAESTTS